MKTLIRVEVDPTAMACFMIAMRTQTTAIIGFGSSFQLEELPLKTTELPEKNAMARQNTLVKGH